MDVKNWFVMLTLVFFSIEKASLQPITEHNLAPEAFAVNHPDLLKMEAFFEEKYFSKGISPAALGEGTGYFPYLRAKIFYEMHKDFRGRVDGSKRWEIFQKMRASSLERGVPAPAADWENVGPNKMEGQGGRMLCHAFDPQNSQVIWAGSATGGLWLTENGGDTWQPMTDQIPSTGVGAVAVNPLNANTLLIGTGEGFGQDYSFTRSGLGVFKSTNRGLTWVQTDFDHQFAEHVSSFKIVWNYADTNIVWLAATNGFWRSTDGGKTWTNKLGDGTNQQNFICTDLVQHPTDPQKLYISITRDGIYRSTDGGENWSKLTNGLPANDLHSTKISLCKSHPDVLFASMVNATDFGIRGLFRTGDGGDSWQQIQNAPNAFCIPFQPDICQGWYDNAVAISPTDPNTVWLCGMTLWRSTDGGQNWTEHDRYKVPGGGEPPACLTYVDQHDFAFDPENTQIVYAFNDGGVAKSTDGGACFEFKNEGLMTAQFYSIAAGRSDPGVIIGSTQDHGLQGIKLSENTNLAWDRWAFPEGGRVAVHRTNANILYGNGFDGKYYRSLNGVHILASPIANGMNVAENGGFWFGEIRLHPTDPKTLLGSTRQKLYKSTNQGLLWTPVATIKEPWLFEFDQADPGFAYCAAWSNDGTRSFWRSENSGDTWEQLPQNPGWRVTDIKSSPQQPGLIYVSRNSNLPNVPHIYTSENYGDSWTAIQGNLPDLTVNAIAVHHFVPGTIFAATDLGVFITTDNGVNWTEYNDNLPVSVVNDIEFNPADTSLLIGTYGRGAWRTKAWMPEVSPAEEVFFENNRLKIAPNPAGETVRFSFFLADNATVRLDILNATGQMVATVFSDKLPAGEHEYYWNGFTSNGLRATAGTYFLKMTTGRQAFLEKLIIH